MSGHSHWATIKRKKEANDQKRGQVFSKLAKAISAAARHGADPATNFKLRLLVDKAKQVNMPKENVNRAIRKGIGSVGGAGLQEVVYEGYGPDGVAVIVEAITDNRNRTTAAIKNIFERSGGKLASPGAVAFQFRQKGWLLVAKSDQTEDQLLRLIDLGVEDVEESRAGIEVFTAADQLDQIKKDLEKAGFQVKEAEIVYQPITPIKLKNQAKVLALLESLDDQDEVQKVSTNLV